MAWLRRILVVGLVAATMYGAWRLAGENSSPVTVSYVFGEWIDVTQWVVLLVAFACGALLGVLLCTYQGTKSWLMRRRYRRRVAELESEVQQLRNLPLAPEDPRAATTGGASGSA